MSVEPLDPYVVSWSHLIVTVETVILNLFPLPFVWLKVFICKIFNCARPHMLEIREFKLATSPPFSVPLDPDPLHVVLESIHINIPIFWLSKPDVKVSHLFKGAHLDHLDHRHKHEVFELKIVPLAFET